MSDEPPAAVSARRRWWFAGAGLVVIAAVLLALAVRARVDGDSPDAMDERAAQVMPFDLAKTSHSFTKTDDGGVEAVVAHDAGDTRNVGLIRSHLQDEATRFRRGDFRDPAKIHGMDMPGLRELEAGAGRIEVVYRDLDAGGELTYRSDEPALVDALHSWFDRQSADHSMPGM